MNNLYKIEELVPPSFFQRLFKKTPKENAFIEVNNLIATRPIGEIKIEEIVSITEKYKIDLRKRYLDRLKELYLRSLINCLSDNTLDNQDVVSLNHLKDLLALSDSEVEEINNQEASKIYDKFYQEAISDGKIDKSEEEFLDKLKENLRLPTIIEEKISNERRSQFMQIQFNQIASDKKISPDEWENFESIAENLDVTIRSDGSIEKLKLYWLIENGALPIMDVSINLQKGEQCYFSCDANWLETRTVTRRINYGGPTARIKIMKGVYYRAGSIGIKRITSEELQTIDSGQVYVTNKRLIFLGSKKNSNIKLDKILSLNPYSDGVGIEKDSGKSPILQVEDNADILTMTIGRVINDL